MEGQVPEERKLSRRDELMELQQAIAFESAEELAARAPVMEAFVEGRLSEEDIYIARTYRDAPDVDGLVFFTGGGELLSGEIVRVRITGSHEYDLTGEMYDEFTE